MVNNFTIEDMGDLYKYLSETDLDDTGHAPLNDCQRVMNLLEFFNYNADRMIKDSPLLLSALGRPFEDMPLLINDDCYIDILLAKWRLRIGK